MSARREPPPPPPPREEKQPPKTLKERMAMLEANSTGKRVEKIDAASELSQIPSFDFEARRRLVQTKLSYIGGPFGKYVLPRSATRHGKVMLWPAWRGYEVRIGAAAAEQDDDGAVDVSGLPDGRYEVKVSVAGASPALPLETTWIDVKDGASSVELLAVEDAAPLLVAVSEADVSLGAGKRVRATCDIKGLTHHLEALTDEDGVAPMLVPQGARLTDLRAEIDAGEIRRTEPIVVRRNVLGQGSDAAVAPNLVSLLHKATTCGAAIGWTCCAENAKVVVLGDVSFSMNRGRRLDVLRRSLLDFLDATVLDRKAKVALGAFDDGPVEWASTTWIQDPDHAYSAADWIGALEAKAGTNVRRAIEEAAIAFPDATDVYVLGDGDVEPLRVPGEGGTSLSKPDDKPEFYPDTDFAAFRNRFPTTRFHFVAFGKDADRARMQQMTTIGGGAHTDVRFEDDGEEEAREEDALQYQNNE